MSTLPEDGRTGWRAQLGVEGYDGCWRRLAASGQNPHGVADLVAGYGPHSVLDAGCGTGRVAIELGRRGVDVLGVDLAPDMIAAASRAAAGAAARGTWCQAGG
ncbi:MAG TPA: methyltransferase domain-containing protein [Pseudonocardia sp.]|nr:methyltransferase domain-containing protein [Pseudonocardia sp.]